jgi:hypothetical protein
MSGLSEVHKENTVIPFRKGVSDQLHQERVIPQKITNTNAAEKQKLLIIITHYLHGSTFLQSLYEDKPKTIIDLNWAACLNFTAVDSDTTKRWIQKIGADYIQKPTPFHEWTQPILRHNPRVLADEITNLVKSSPRNTMIMFQYADIANAFSPFLLGSFARHFGGQWEATFIK